MRFEMRERAGRLSRSGDEVLGARMMNDDGGGALLGFEEKTGSEPDADVLFGLEQGEELGLIFKVRACRVAEGVPRAAILLVKQVAYVGRVLAGDAQFFAHQLVMVLGKGFGGFDAQAMQIKILCVLAGFEEPLRLDRCL